MHTIIQSINPLSAILILLAAFIVSAVGSFSIRYLEGDKKKKVYFRDLLFLSIFTFLMLRTRHLVSLVVYFTICDILLVKMMQHKSKWKAAHQFARLVSTYFGSATFLMAISFLCLYLDKGHSHILQITDSPSGSVLELIALGLLLVALIIQSGVLPFHRWLLSSLNSPTPVSALMHGGLINVGGFILALFAPLYLEYPLLLHILFLVGATSALLGTLLKLLQSDIKRFLACSTVAQMGFMLMQCGLGLFPAAIAHLCWHGLFKSYLFLNSGSAAQRVKPPGFSVNGKKIALSILCGLFAAGSFGYFSDKNPCSFDTNIFPVFIAFIAGMHLSLPLLKEKPIKRLPVTILTATVLGAVYGLHVYCIEYILAPMELMQPQPLNPLHIAVLFLFFATSTAGLTLLQNKDLIKKSPLVLKAYVFLINMSQPHPKTITTKRCDYEY